MLPQLTPSEIARFWSKVEKTETCWLWSGTVDDKGYGRFRLNPGPDRPGYLYAHILGRHLIYGPFPDGAWVCHDCPGGDNPLCVLHTFLGDADANNKDMAKKGRTARGDRHGSHLHPESVPRGDRHPWRQHPERVPRAESHPRTPFTWDDVHAIRAQYAAGAHIRDLAATYHVAYNSIWQIVNYRSWLEPRPDGVHVRSGNR